MEVIRDYDRVLLIELDVWVINCVHRRGVSGDNSYTHTHTHTHAHTHTHTRTISTKITILNPLIFNWAVSPPTLLIM